MCGICGWLGRGCLPGAIMSMTSRLHHRGPDDSGQAAGDGWQLGFTRLSILDLSPLGHQPMETDDGRFNIAFNGEIYNFIELRRDLESRGERFRSDSDTEVLLRLLARHGHAALNMLNGMFAIAFIDTRARTFLLARDRLGVKPLYYVARGDALIFASEIKALLTASGIERTVDRVAVMQYLMLGYLPSETCIFSHFSKIRPGHYLAGSLDEPHAARQVAYWSLPRCEDRSDRPITPDEIDELHALLEDAVALRLRSDVSVGVFLSGGIDSGLIASLSAKVSNRPLVAFTVGFEDTATDETDLARDSARHAGLEHRVIMQRQGGPGDIDELAGIYDEPFGDASALPTSALCRAASEHATVFLSGDGGDEAFGGYRRYIECQRHRTLIAAASRIGQGLRVAARLTPELSLTRFRLAKLGLADCGAAAVFDEMPEDRAIRHVLHDDLRPLTAMASRPVWERWSRDRDAPLIERQQRLDYHLYLPDDVLVKMDRASMAHSIEVRSPFLDWRLVEWAARLPRSSLLDTRQGKLPLRRLAARVLPASVQRGAKRGFGVPLGGWFRQRAGLEMLRTRLLSRNARELGFWDTGRVEHLIACHASGQGRDFGLLLWRLLMLDAWWHLYASPSATSAHASGQSKPLATDGRSPETTSFDIGRVG